MTLNRVLGPSAQVQIKDVLDKTKDDVFYNFNCVQVGSIISYDPAKNTASVQIQMKRELPNNSIVDYPPLQDCPVMFLSGGTSYLSFPILTGDSCVILFNDRDIDTWWATGSSNVPPSARAHSLSDAIIFVGVRNQSNKQTLLPTTVDLNGGEQRIAIRNTYDSLKSILDALLLLISGQLIVWFTGQLLPAIEGITINMTGPQAGTVTAASIANLEATKVQLLSIQTQVLAIKTRLNLLLSEGI
jgi:hypothetical protein